MRRPAATAALAIGAGIVASGEASAHVKWFCAYDVAGQPRGLASVLCPDFELLVALSMLVLTIGCLLEGTALGAGLLRALDRVTTGLRSNAELLVRVTCGGFFVALWAMGGVLLTPELKTASPVIPWVQLAIAAGLIWRPTMPLSALGIVALFAIAVSQYGAFHLADYPVFLGVAAYLALTGLGRDLFGARPLDVVRWAAGVTLMWASVEKWAYPEWSFGLLIAHPSLTLGFDNEFVMRAAGVVEFVLAFALLWTPLVRRAAAAILAAAFVAAIFEFGKIDAIGHAPIIVVLLAIVGDNAPAPARRPHPLLAPVGYGAALTGFLLAYYLGHATLFGSNMI